MTNNVSPLKILAFSSNSRIEHAAFVITKYKDELDKDPVHAITWSDNMMLEAARMKAHQVLQEGIARMLDNHSEEEIITLLQQQYTRRVVQDAQNTSTSSSAMTNLMATNAKIAAAEILDLLLTH